MAVGLCVGFVALLAICWPFVKDRAPLVTTISATTPPAEVELRPSRGGLTLDGVVRSDVEAEGTNGVVVELPSASFVSGRVLDEDGWPVAGVPVEATSSNAPPVVATTSADGAYRLGPFKGGQAVVVQAGSPELGSTKGHEVVAPRVDLGLVLRRRVVRGLVTNGMTGKPLDRFRVRVFSLGSELTHRTHPVVDESGAFLVPVNVETYAIAIDAPGRFPWFSQFAAGDIREHDLGTIALDGARAIAGRVLDARSGAPIAHATAGIEARSGDPLYLQLLITRPTGTDADENGVFRLGNLPDASVRVTVAATGYARETVGVDQDDDFIEVFLHPGATVAGSLVLPDGTPATGFATISNLANGRGYGKPVEGGTFEWDGLGDGEYEVSAESNEGAVASRTVRIQDGQSVRDIRLVAMPLGTLSGTVTGLFPGEEATVRVRDEDGRRVASRLSGNGVYSVRGVPAGMVTVVVRTTAERSMVRHLRFDERGEERIDLDFAGRSRLRGVVTAGARPLGAVRLTVTPEDRSHPSVEATTSELGQYVVQGLADGRHVVRIHTGHAFKVDVGHDTVFDMRLADISLAGTVLAAGTGETIRRAWVELARVEPSGESAVVWESHVAGDGGFRVDGLAEGEYVVRASAPDFLGVSRKVRITGAEFVDLGLERR